MQIILPEPDQLVGLAAPYAPAAGVSAVLGLVYAAVRFDHAHPQVKHRVLATLTTPRACHAYLLAIAAGWCRYAQHVRDWRAATGLTDHPPTPGLGVVVPAVVVSAAAVWFAVLRIVASWPKPGTPAAAAGHWRDVDLSRVASQLAVVDNVRPGVDVTQDADGAATVWVRTGFGLSTEPLVRLVEHVGGTLAMQPASRPGGDHTHVVRLPREGVYKLLTAGNTGVLARRLVDATAISHQALTKQAASSAPTDPPLTDEERHRVLTAIWHVPGVQQDLHVRLAGGGVVVDLKTGSDGTRDPGYADGTYLRAAIEGVGGRISREKLANSAADGWVIHLTSTQARRLIDPDAFGGLTLRQYVIREVSKAAEAGPVVASMADTPAQEANHIPWYTPINLRAGLQEMVEARLPTIDGVQGVRVSWRFDGVMCVYVDVPAKDHPCVARLFSMASKLGMSLLVVDSGSPSSARVTLVFEATALNRLRGVPDIKAFV